MQGRLADMVLLPLRYRLAGPGEDDAVFLEVREGQDRLVEPGDLVDLGESGIERFITAPREAKTFEIRVNSRARTAEDRAVSFEQVVQLDGSINLIG